MTVLNCEFPHKIKSVSTNIILAVWNCLRFCSLAFKQHHTQSIGLQSGKSNGQGPKIVIPSLLKKQLKWTSMTLSAILHKQYWSFTVSWINDMEAGQWYRSDSSNVRWLLKVCEWRYNSFLINPFLLFLGFSSFWNQMSNILHFKSSKNNPQVKYTSPGIEDKLSLYWIQLRFNQPLFRSRLTRLNPAVNFWKTFHDKTRIYWLHFK